MLRIVEERTNMDECHWQEAHPDGVITGLHEDTDYLLEIGREDADVFVDDVALERIGPTIFRWRPSFYAGRVVAIVATTSGTNFQFFLDVSPCKAKSGAEEFDLMVEQIMATDELLMSGTSSATMDFGREGRTGRYELDVLLSRVRQHGPAFLAAVETIARAPHRFLVADRRLVPLSRIRRLDPASLRDRHVWAIAAGHPLGEETMDSLQLNSQSSALTFDTPANQALLLLLKRFQAAVMKLEDAAKELRLGTPQEEQKLRLNRRVTELAVLEKRSNELLFTSFFREVSVARASATGLTQISAQPLYSRAYRLGHQALTTAIKGTSGSDQLHVPPSWGVYETWCFLKVVEIVAEVAGNPPVLRQHGALSADRAVQIDCSEKGTIQLLLQATFPSVSAKGTSLARSLSRERRPDVVLVQIDSSWTKALVLDAKWRSGRDNTLDAMASVHIYHDALRVGKELLTPCLLLLPGQPQVKEIEQDAFIDAYGVGAISDVRVGGSGLVRLKNVLGAWMNKKNSEISAH